MTAAPRGYFRMGVGPERKTQNCKFSGVPPHEPQQMPLFRQEGDGKRQWRRVKQRDGQ